MTPGHAGAAMSEPAPEAPVTRLFPDPPETRPLRGLYLDQAVRRCAPPFVYANFVTSLDGRIALGGLGGRSVPAAVANPRDWRLFQELAVQADCLLTTGRYLRQLAGGSAQDVLPIGPQPEFDDLWRWRREAGLPPQPAVAVVSASLELPDEIFIVHRARELYVVTGAGADPAGRARLERRGVRVLTAGDGARVEGRPLVDALRAHGQRWLYTIGGPQLLHSLVAADALDRLYLTFAHRLLGGTDFDSLITGAALDPAPELRLAALHLDAHAPGPGGQCFARFDRA